MRPYHPDNLKSQPYSPFRVVLLAWAAKLLGIQFKIAGTPFGADYDKAKWDRLYDTSGARSIS